MVPLLAPSPGGFGKALAFRLQYWGMNAWLVVLFLFATVGLPAWADLPTVQPGARLVGARLNNSQFNDQDLFKANFTRAQLIRADLQRAQLSQAQFDRAKLMGANFEGANLTQADFSGANLISVNLQQANLTGATFRHSTLRKAKLTGADLRGATLLYARLEGADLTGIQWDETTHFRLARYDRLTRFPEGFEPLKHAMINSEKPTLSPAARIANPRLRL
jgi:uncharacterized protein YjbI with pentapeptide repeats